MTAAVTSLCRPCCRRSLRKSAPVPQYQHGPDLQRSPRPLRTEPGFSHGLHMLSADFSEATGG
jgi:hypothetical protein